MTVSVHTFAEGVAAHLSALEAPGHRYDEYLCFDATQPRWPTECEQTWRAAASTRREVQDEPGGGAAERRFYTFRPGGADTGIPSRFGYYARWRVVRVPARTHVLTQLLTLDILTAGHLAREHLRQITTVQELTDG